jgi:hypothetical protein
MVEGQAGGIPVIRDQGSFGTNVHTAKVVCKQYNLLKEWRCDVRQVYLIDKSLKKPEAT